MIKHVVLLQWKATTTEADIVKVREGLSKLPAQIPEIASYQHGTDAQIFKGNADYVLIAEFANEQDFKTYTFHPAHQAFLNEVAAPILESFSSAQFINE